MFKIITTILIGSIFVGCSTTNQSSITYEKYKPNKEVKPLHVKKTKAIKVSDSTISGTIKGNITKLKYTKKAWHYRVESTDTSNNKLSLADFSHTKKVASDGDLVYAIIKDGKLKEIFLIKKANYKKKKIKQKHTKPKKSEVKTYKRTKKRQVLGVPSSEKISLD